MKIETVRTGQIPGGFPELPPDWNEIILATRGRAQLHVGSEEYRIGTGMVAYLPAGMPHTISSGSDWACTVVRFPDQRDAREAPTAHSGPLIFPDHDGVFAKLMNLAADVQLEDAEGMQAISLCLGDAIFHLFQHCRSLQRLGSNEAVEQISRLIREHFHEPDLDLAAEIEKTGYCLSHFRRIFKAVFGRPPQQQLNHVRIEYAKLLLARSRESVRAVSLRSGFRDPYYFSRMFRQAVGCAPTEYAQRMHREGDAE